MAMTHVTVSPGARLELPWSRDHNALVYVLSGRGTVGTDSRPIGSGQLAVFGAGDALTIAADATQDGRTPAFDVLVLGGRPIREEVAWYGPFVMNTQDELRQAFDDFRAGRMGAIPATH
jgi:redox-sensitive bicupin YhaK (pirin superfamily)